MDNYFTQAFPHLLTFSLGLFASILLERLKRRAGFTDSTLDKIEEWVNQINGSYSIMSLDVKSALGQKEKFEEFIKLQSQHPRIRALADSLSSRRDTNLINALEKYMGYCGKEIPAWIEKNVEAGDFDWGKYNEIIESLNRLSYGVHLKINKRRKKIY